MEAAQKNVSCCLVTFRFQSYSKHNSKHYDIFPILCHLHLSRTTLKKTKKQFHRLLLHTFNMKWTIGFQIVNGIIIISVLQIYDTELIDCSCKEQVFAKFLLVVNQDSCSKIFISTGVMSKKRVGEKCEQTR